MRRTLHLYRCFLSHDLPAFRGNSLHRAKGFVEWHRPRKGRSVSGLVYGAPSLGYRLAPLLPSRNS